MSKPLYNQPIEKVQSKYAGFWRRFGAIWIDLILMFPIIWVQLKFKNNSYFNYVIFTILGFLTAFLFHTVFVKMWGGSPGKLVLKIKIVKVNGEKVGWKEAILRHIVDHSIAIISHLIVFYVLYNAQINWGNISGKDFFIELKKLTPPIYNTLQIVFQIWMWGELLVLLFNEQKRALHDFIAGTIVVKNYGDFRNDVISRS